jgi:hypothetical protein
LPSEEKIAISLFSVSVEDSHPVGISRMSVSSQGFPTDTERECGEERECVQLEARIPHGECSGTTNNAGILHPATPTTTGDRPATPTGGRDATSSAASSENLVKTNGHSPTGDKVCPVSSLAPCSPEHFSIHDF